MRPLFSKNRVSSVYGSGKPGKVSAILLSGKVREFRDRIKSQEIFLEAIEKLLTAMFERNLNCAADLILSGEFPNFTRDFFGDECVDTLLKLAFSYRVSLDLVLKAGRFSGKIKIFRRSPK